MDTVIVVFIVTVFLAVPLASLQCIYLGVRYWQRPMMLSPRPPVLLTLGVLFGIASIFLWTSLPVFKTI